MKKLVLLACIITCLMGCATKSEQGDGEQMNASISDDSTKADSSESLLAIHFALDSLLTFDSEAELKKSFGEQVIHSTGYYPEGMGEYQNTVLFPNTINEVEFVWEDDSLNFSGLAYLRIAGKHTAWRTAEGITLGTTLKELEQLNKKPFSFFGFGWDYAGAVDWNEGKLVDRKVGVSLDFPGDAIPPEFDALLGDHEISSDAELAQKANPIVSEIVMRRIAK